MSKRVLKNGFIYRGGKFLPGSILIDNRSISAISDGEIIAPDAEISDLSGAWVMPGFEDAHTHPAGRARTLKELDLRNKDITWTEATEIIRNKAQQTPIGEFVVCHGWNAEKWNVNRSELDRLSSDRGIFMINISYHGGMLNSCALKILKRDDVSLEHSNGFVSELEYQKVFIATSPNMEAYMRFIPEYHKRMFALGIVAAHDMNVATLEQLTAYGRLDEAGQLKMRTFIYLNPCLFDKGKDLTKYISHKGKMMEVRGLKLFLDGAIGTHTAALTSDYSDGHGAGHIRTNYDECARLISKAAGLGLQDIAMHCIGDAGVALAVKLFEDLRDKYSGKIKSWRFEHFELPDARAIDSLKHGGGIASMQPNFSWDALNYAKSLGDRVWKINPLKQILSAGVSLVFGSDDMPSGPIEGIRWATSLAPSETQRLTEEESVAAYTHSPALITGAGASRGKIEKGFEANLAVFAENPLDKQSDHKVSQLWIHGKKVFDQIESNP
ncbi:MAG: hypothetical protein A3B23_01230 [Candidatus Colwellbacteria bacterium RIFCSPLOWO2_01_FULL_48_10]|uniref:Amidohydrolase 3 domain-containing protein n=1 Tax=Candidatus Colwellbacteria bacterium RIFCSPLOWO2_01_FULL_48_10 TaxID=1797690 RepID=A0A1G1Z6Q0_9BACT|nr:MAG: hypothetical protein A3B23_01230 [Candidatus Colwellbacteria bacterium RIFCSPLOWO2_01_FULL_48_10]